MSGRNIKNPGGRVALSPGDHACCIYSTNAELVDIVSDFVVEGLALGERCWYVAASNDDGAVPAALQWRGIHVVNETRRGAFALIPASEAYPVQDTFEPLDARLQRCHRAGAARRLQRFPRGRRDVVGAPTRRELRA